MTCVRLWVVLAVTATAGLLLTITGYTAAHYAQETRDAHATLHAADTLRANNERHHRLWYQPVPSLRTVTAYGSPYNVTIVCTVQGSSAATGGHRTPLNPNEAPAAGDVYVKTCKALAPTEEPVG